MTACCFTILLRFKPIGKFLNTVTEVVYFSDLIDLADSCSSARILERIVCVIVLKLVCIHYTHRIIVGQHHFDTCIWLGYTFLIWIITTLRSVSTCMHALSLICAVYVYTHAILTRSTLSFVNNNLIEKHNADINLVCNLSSCYDN
jgi:hypothetical protein